MAVGSAIFKTRSLATDAVNGGKVHVNNDRPKPSRTVHLGDLLTIRRGPYESVIKVIGLSQQRGPASQAALLYEETEESRQRRETLVQQNKLQSAAPPRRPNKKERRDIIRFLHSED